MPDQTVIVGFVSQKGGTGKSTLARALGAVVAHAGLKVRIADLDPQQHTVLEWDKLRQQNSLTPIDVEAFDTAGAALASAEDDELLIIDAPAHANRGTLEIAEAATLIVQPSGASLDDLRPAVLLFHELVAAGMLLLERHDVILAQPDRNFDRERHTVVREHELLQHLMTTVVVADGWDDESSDAGRNVLLAIDDDARVVGEGRVRL